MDGLYNNDHRVYNQLSPFESSNTVNIIFSQINQLNNNFTNYQISNNKKIESINEKVDFQFNAINEKLKDLSNQVNDLGRKILTPTKESTHRKDDKVLERFNKHINKLNNDIQELSSSLYTGNDNLNRQLGLEKDTVLMGRDPIQNGDVGDVGQKSNNDYRHAGLPEITAIDMDIDNKTRLWQKSLRLRLPAPQPNSAPSSPFTNRDFYIPAPIEGNTTIGHVIGYGNLNGVEFIENPEIHLEELQHISTNKRGSNKIKPGINIQETEVSHSQPYTLMNTRLQNSFQETKTFQSPAKRLSPESNQEHLTPELQGQIIKLPAYHGLENHKETNALHSASIISNQSRTLEIGPETDVAPNSFGQVPNIATEKREILELSKAKDTLITATEKPSKQPKTNIPGITLLKGKKLSTTPQYKLEKSLRNIFEIWKEYEYGINGKPPLRQLEAQYNTKWRNETELRTFLRRKKIYDAIEKGKKAGYHEKQIIEELELLRTYHKFGVAKKKPLLWLYSNIPRKFC